MPSSVPSIYPCAFFNGSVRIDSPAPYNPPVYQQDVRFFAHNRRRRMYLRPVFPGEFGTPTTFRAQPVQVIVWVKQLAIGTHECVAVWVSKDSVPLNQTTDNEVLGLVLEFQRWGGNDRLIWSELVRSWQEYCGQARPMLSSGELQ